MKVGFGPELFVESFRIAAPWIHGHRGKTFVVVVGGEAATERSFSHLMSDVALVFALGVRVVLVHGSRPQIEARLRARSHPSRMVGDIRVTDAVALECAQEAVGVARARFESMLSMGAARTPMAGARIRIASGNFVIARPVGVRDGVDFEYTGEVRRVDAAGIRHQLDAGALVLLGPLGVSPTGEAFSLRAPDVARSVAVALGAEKLIGLVEGGAIVDGDARLVSQLTPEEADHFLGEHGHQLHADQRHHLRAAAAAVREGVPRAHLIDRCGDGTLLTELFTREGLGTLVTTETCEDIRPARLEDVAPLAALLAPLEDEGVLMRRGRERLEIEIDRFIVLERDGMVIGCAALDPFSDDEAGELYCVAIHPRYRATGRGDSLLASIEQRAKAQGLRHLFVLTTRSAHFFQERGFAPAGARALPAARRKRYDEERRSRVLVKTLGA